MFSRSVRPYQRRRMGCASRKCGTLPPRHLAAESRDAVEAINPRRRDDGCSPPLNHVKGPQQSVDAIIAQVLLRHRAKFIRIFGPVIGSSKCPRKCSSRRILRVPDFSTTSGCYRLSSFCRVGWRSERSLGRERQPCTEWQPGPLPGLDACAGLC